VPVLMAVLMLRIAGLRKIAFVAEPAGQAL
jgi:hypothetical protein